MMNIIFNTFPAAFHCPGGGEIQLLKTKEALEELGHNVTLHDTWNPKFEENDLAHFFSVQGGVYNFHYNIKYNFKMPLVVSPILWPSNPDEYPTGEIKNMLDICDVALPNSQMEADLLSQVFDVSPDKFRVAYNGIDPIFTIDNQPNGDLFREKYDIDGEFVLCVGNIEDRKNQVALARSLGKTNIQLILVGNIRDKDYFEEVKKVSNSKMRYIGTINHHSDLLRSAYAACDTFALPSKLETPGLAALEAAAIGCKVVITEEGSTHEYFEQNAIYANPADDQSILNAVEQSLNSQNDKELREKIISKFSWANTAKQTVEGYNLAIARHKEQQC